MKYTIILYCISFFFSISLRGQPVTKNISGQVSFLSPQNIYVRFNSTEGINVHDTLYMSSGDYLVPVLVVNNLSSTSCLCSAISSEDLPVGHLIIAKARPAEARQGAKTLEEVKNEKPFPATVNEPAVLEKPPATSGAKSKSSLTKQRINGGISAASYSDFSNTAGADLQHFRYTLSLNAVNIAESRLSAESYISFRHKSGGWSEVKSNIFNDLKIYSLALKYEIDSTTQIRFGRQVNPRISSVGSFDGLALEKSISRFSLGLIGGSRPDYRNYGFDPKLLQYGAYVSYNFFNDRSYSGTSLAFMNQLYSGKTDRRFLYFQNSGTLAKNVSLFSSFEFDLFKLRNDKAASTFDLTSLYMAVNYRISGNLTISGSYDARKNPVYYETFKTLLDTLIENGLRQCYRISSNIRITKSLMLGVQSSWRFLKSDLHQSKNVSGYLSYSSSGNNFIIATLSGNYVETSFIKGANGGITLLKNMSAGKIQTSVGYNYQDYTIPEGGLKIRQHMGKADFYWQAGRKTSISLNYEITFEARNQYNRLYVQIMKRF